MRYIIKYILIFISIIALIISAAFLIKYAIDKSNLSGVDKARTVNNLQNLHCIKCVTDASGNPTHVIYIDTNEDIMYSYAYYYSYDCENNAILERVDLDTIYMGTGEIRN